MLLTHRPSQRESGWSVFFSLTLKPWGGMRLLLPGKSVKNSMSSEKVLTTQYVFLFQSFRSQKSAGFWSGNGSPLSSIPAGTLFFQISVKKNADFTLMRGVQSTGGKSMADFFPWRQLHRKHTGILLIPSIPYRGRCRLHYPHNGLLFPQTDPCQPRLGPGW